LFEHDLFGKPVSHFFRIMLQVASGTAWQFHDAASEDRQLVILVTGFLLDLDQVPSASTYLRFTLPLINRISPSGLCRRILQVARRRKPSSPIQLVMWWVSQEQRSGP